MFTNLSWLSAIRLQAVSLRASQQVATRSVSNWMMRLRTLEKDLQKQKGEQL